MFEFQNHDTHTSLTRKNVPETGGVVVFIVDDEYLATATINKDYKAELRNFTELRLAMEGHIRSRERIARAPWALMEVPEIASVFVGGFPVDATSKFWLTEEIVNNPEDNGIKYAFLIDHLQSDDSITLSILTVKRLLNVGANPNKIFSYSSAPQPKVLNDLEKLGVSKTSRLSKQTLDRDPLSQWNSIVRPLI